MPRIREGKTKRTLDAAVSAAGMRIMQLLVGNPPQSVAELIRSTGVTRTAVTEQLNELVAAGFVERTIERLPGRGRPRHLFKATNVSLQELFSGSQGLLVPAVWQAISEIGGDKLKRRVLKRASRVMADYYRPRITGKTPRERLAQLAGLLREEGNLLEITESGNGKAVVRKRTCSFISMFEETRAVCYVDQEMMNLLLGTRVRLTASRHDGAPCCCFTVHLSNGK